jgi:oligosaccharide:H+ symporter
MQKVEKRLTILVAQLSLLRAGPWSMKFFYLCLFGYVGIITAYLGLYLVAIGLSGTQIGVITSIFPLAGAVMQPVWGTISDRYGWRKPLLICTLIIATLTALIVPLAHSFALLLLTVTVLAMALSPASPLADAITLQWISEHGGSYGAVRVYGTLGYLLAAPAAGIYLANWGTRNLFFLLSLMLGCTFVVSFTTPSQAKIHTPPDKHGRIRIILHDRVLVLFLLFCALGYSTFQAYDAFFSLYLHDLGSGTVMIGIAIALSVVSELPAMALASHMIRILGTKRLLLIGFSIATVRWVAYAVLPNPNLALVFQTLHGLSFTAFFVAALTFINRRVPIHLRTTGQTLFYGATFGLGSWAGGTFFGILYDHLNIRGMFLVAGFICTITCGGLLLVTPKDKIT